MSIKRKKYERCVREKGQVLNYNRIFNHLFLACSFAFQRKNEYFQLDGKKHKS